MTFEPERAAQHRRELAQALRDLRRASGLTGDRLAARTDMSQAKISKIENGRMLPSTVDVERILHALDVNGEARQAVIELTRIANIEYRGFRADLQRGLGQVQRELAAVEASAASLRYFLPCLITGLLQTPEYARQSLSHPLVNCGAQWEQALARRLERQAVLYDSAKRFTFLLTEAALRWPLCPPSVMAVQMDRIVSLSELVNVTIGVVPADSQIPSGPLNGFVIYDDRLVTVEVFTGEVILRDPRDIVYSEQIFAFFQENSLLDDSARVFLRKLAREYRESASGSEREK